MNKRVTLPPTTNTTSISAEYEPPEPTTEQLLQINEVLTPPTPERKFKRRIKAYLVTLANEYKVDVAVLQGLSNLMQEMMQHYNIHNVNKKEPQELHPDLHLENLSKQSVQSWVVLRDMLVGEWFFVKKGRIASARQAIFRTQTSYGMKFATGLFDGEDYYIKRVL